MLYGTDAYSDVALALIACVPPRSNYLQGWGKKAWLLDRTARDALAIALTDMLADRVVDAARVEQLASMVMRENAVDLYHL